MKCAEFERVVEALARQESLDDFLRRSALAHAEGCPACRHQFDQAQALTETLHELALQNKKIMAPAKIEALLLHAFDTREARNSMARWVLQWRYRWLAVAASAVAAVGIALLFWNLSMDSISLEQPSATSRSEEVIASEFFPLQEELELPATESGGVIRVALPRATLLAFGLPMNPELALEPLQAEILMGEDGTARAIRFLHEGQ